MEEKNKKSNSDLVKNINYKLSFEYKVKNSETLITTINRLKINQLKDYIYNNYYVKSSRVKDINRERLLNDLVVFKAYKEDLEINIKNEDLFIVFMTLLLNITSIVLNVSKSMGKVYIESIIDFMSILTSILAASLIWLLLRTGVKSYSSKLKVVNYGIHTLETLKEEMDRKKLVKKLKP